MENSDSKSAEGNLVGVRFPLPAPIKSMIYQINTSLDAFFCAQTVPKVAEDVSGDSSESQTRTTTEHAVIRLQADGRGCEARHRAADLGEGYV